jgi:hypothetical protein
MEPSSCIPRDAADSELSGIIRELRLLGNLPVPSAARDRTWALLQNMKKAARQSSLKEADKVR